MRAPLSWLRQYVDVPADLSGRALGDLLVPLGMEVEAVDERGDDLSGPLVLGEVREIEELAEFKKPIRWCRVDVGPHNADDGAGGLRPRGVICGATNFAVGDLVVVALPGTVLPGGFTITARKTYGHVSDGMICSVLELGIGDDHSGILVLPPGTGTPGVDLTGVLGVRETVLDLEITPDCGHLESVRGLARETSYVTGGAFRDPRDAVKEPAPDPAGWPVRIDDPSGCRRFSALTVSGLDPSLPSPLWLRTRLHHAGVRSVSLAVDVTNYVMLELGQPMHAFDAARLTGGIVVRRATAGEKLVTIDHVTHSLDADDMVVADETGAVALAGVMGGAESEISDTTVDLLLEAAWWDPASIGRAVRRHRLPSEASRRFERGVDPEIAVAALQRAAELLVEYGDASVGALTVTGGPYDPPVISLASDLPARTIGLPIDPVTVTQRLQQVGCDIPAGEPLVVRPPSWRPDLRDPADLVEEVARLEGYERIPEVVPTPPPGRGLTDRQRFRRRVGRALAYTGYVEAISPPWVSEADWDALGLDASDPRRNAFRLANPLSDEQPLLRTTLLPGLLRALRRNVGRGLSDVALFETGLVYRSGGEDVAAGEVLRPGVEARPAPEVLARIERVLPDQPERVAVVLAGDRSPAGWWGAGRAAGWADAVEAARTVAAEAGVELVARHDEHAPWHPGRCAALLVGDTLVGHAGELHPRVVEAYGLPPRTCAAELSLSALPVEDAPPAKAVPISAYPPAFVDVALSVDATTPVAEVEAALRDGAGELLEALRLFDVYTGEQVGADRRSLAYRMCLRALDRTLTAQEVNDARDAAVAEATRRVGAVLRERSPG
ncbi:MAG: phenylalanine--tRNA ligase subunit beta [Streptosporangiales bacterium]|nr:phenylalanine--tRNA ligase subunit beta [Streptosporangiales bacterium]